MKTTDYLQEKRKERNNMETTLLNIKDILEKYRDEFTEEEKRQTEDFDLIVETLMRRGEA